MIEYQRALARALTRGGGDVPGVPDEAVARFARLAERKRAALAGRRRGWLERLLRGIQALR